MTATTTVGISSWWIGGQAGPDARASQVNQDQQNTAYYYVYVGRNSETGDESNPSPPCRAGVFSRRQFNTIQLTQHPDPQIDKLDVYRYGGSLLQWIYVGSVDNSTANPTFTDKLPDSSILGNKLLSFNKFAPFPQVGIPTSGTCDIVGNRLVWKTGPKFDTTYALGVQVLLNGRAYTLYNSPDSDELIELTESAGSFTDAAFEFPNPLRLAQPLPYVWGPFGQGELGLVNFACGDPLNPNILYWTNAGDPGSTSDRNQLEVTSPNEPLINGCIYDAKCYLISSERMFLVTPLQLADGSLSFRSDEVANSKGLYSPYALTVERLS